MGERARLFKKSVLLFLFLTIINSSSGCRGMEPVADNDAGAGSPTVNADTQNKNMDTDADPMTADIPGWQKDAGEALTLDWYVNFSWFTTGWGENLVSKTITEETGVSVNFITPMGSEKEKLNALIASDSLPDLITLGWWEAQVSEMSDQGMVYALNELADQYDPYFWKVADPVVVNWYTREDGNIYCYPNSTCTPEDFKRYDNIASNQTFLVRKDIYEAIGSPDMTTRSGFQAAVEAAAKSFPEVGGKPLIPVGAHEFTENGCVSFDQYLQNFLAVPYEKDGRAYDRNTDPEYIAWLKMFRELGEEGLLSDDIFTDQRTQMEEKLAQGRYFCMLYQRTDMEKQEKLLYVNNPDSIYIAIDGPKNSHGDDHVLPPTGINGWTVTLISKKCEHPDRAIELLSYLLSEHGQKLTYLGVEGVTYDTADEEQDKPVVREDVAKLLNTDREAYDRLYGADDAYWMLQNNMMQLQWQQDVGEPLGQLKEWTYPYTRYLGQYDYYFPTDSKLGVIDSRIKELWSETLPKLLLATSEGSFDGILADFTEEREASGYQELLDACTEQMEETKIKLGIVSQ